MCYLVHKCPIVLKTSCPLLVIFTGYLLNIALQCLLSLRSQDLTSIGIIVSKPKTLYHAGFAPQSTQTTLQILPSPDPHTKTERNSITKYRTNNDVEKGCISTHPHHDPEHAQKNGRQTGVIGRKVVRVDDRRHIMPNGRWHPRIRLVCHRQAATNLTANWVQIVGKTNSSCAKQIKLTAFLSPSDEIRSHGWISSIRHPPLDEIRYPKQMWSRYHPTYDDIRYHRWMLSRCHPPCGEIRYHGWMI